MGDVRVPYGDSAADTATLLLAAAEEAELSAGVVRTQSSPDFHFLVPEEVAKAAGVDYESDEEPAPEEPKKTTRRKAAEKGD